VDCCSGASGAAGRRNPSRRLCPPPHLFRNGSSPGCCYQGIRAAIVKHGADVGISERDLLPTQVAGETAAEILQSARAAVAKNSHLILGGATEEQAEMLAEFAQQARIPFIAMVAANDELTSKGEYIFRVHSPESVLGKVLARFAYENLNCSRAAVLVQSNRQSLVTARSFAEVFEKLGGRAELRVTFEDSDADISGQLAMLKGKNPPALFLAASRSQVAERAVQLRQAGIDSALLAPYLGDLRKLLELSEEQRKECYFASPFEADPTRAEVTEFVSDFGEVPGAVEYPPPEAALGYDAALLALDAIKRAPSLEASALRDALAQARNIAGVTGVFSIDELGDPKKRVAIVGLKEPKPELKARLLPPD
jgi:branched-chain amino acid transport system substrate-binding protein